jgi:hypothetical protein
MQLVHFSGDNSMNDLAVPRMCGVRHCLVCRCHSWIVSLQSSQPEMCGKIQQSLHCLELPQEGEMNSSHWILIFGNGNMSAFKSKILPTENASKIKYCLQQNHSYCWWDAAAHRFSIARVHNQLHITWQPHWAPVCLGQAWYWCGDRPCAQKQSRICSASFFNSWHPVLHFFVLFLSIAPLRPWSNDVKFVWRKAALKVEKNQFSIWKRGALDLEQVVVISLKDLFDYILQMQWILSCSFHLNGKQQTPDFTMTQFIPDQDETENLRI